MPRDAKIMLRLREEIKDKLKVMADARGIALSAFASYVIGEYVHNQERFANPMFDKLQEEIVKVLADGAESYEPFRQD